MLLNSLYSIVTRIANIMIVIMNTEIGINTVIRQLSVIAEKIGVEKGQANLKKGTVRTNSEC